jgi:16S rRNA (guanine966-N2)-methyltransferase
MRIISGIYKGRKLNPPRKNPARPTTDIAKEGLFNILHNNLDIESLSFLDLFGGTGNISFEMASRGCTQISNIELYGPNVNFIQKTSELLHAPILAIRDDVFRFIANCPDRFDLIFAGPPYKLKNIDKIPDLIFQYELLKPDGWFVIEHDPSQNFDDHKQLRHRRTYGSTNFSIFIHN